MTTLIRRILGAVLALAAPALVLLTYAALSGRLPDRLAVHWDVHGRVNNTAGVVAFFTGTLLVAVVLALAAIAATFLAHSPVAGRMLATLLIFGAWVAAGVWTVTAGVAVGATQVAETPMPWYLVLLVIAVPMVLAALAWVLLPGAWQHPDAPVRPASTLHFEPGESVVWVDQAAMAWAKWVAAVAAVAAVVMFWTLPPAAIPLAVIALALALTSELTVRIDARGVHTLWGPFGWPRPRVPLEQITAARCEEIRPAQWGGWGYRVSPRGVAAVIRRGPGLVVSRSGRPDYAVTIPHAVAGASVLNALLAREHANRP